MGEMASTSHQQESRGECSTASWSLNEKQSLRTTAFRLFKNAALSNEDILSISSKISSAAIEVVKLEFEKKDYEFNNTKLKDLLRYACYIADSTTNVEYLMEILYFACEVSITKKYIEIENKEGIITQCLDILYNFCLKFASCPVNEHGTRQALCRLTTMFDICNGFTEKHGEKNNLSILMKLYLCKSMLYLKISERDDCAQSLQEAFLKFHSCNRNAVPSKFVYWKMLLQKAVYVDQQDKYSVLEECINAAFTLFRLKGDDDHEIATNVYDLVFQIETNRLLEDVAGIKWLLCKRVRSRGTKKVADYEAPLIFLSQSLLFHTLDLTVELEKQFLSWKHKQFFLALITMRPVAFELTLTVIGRKVTACAPELHWRLVMYAKDLCLLWEKNNLYTKYHNFSRLIEKIVVINEENFPTIDKCVHRVLQTFVDEIGNLEIISNCTWMHERFCHALLYLGYLCAQEQKYEECCQVAKKFLDTASTFVRDDDKNYDTEKATANYLIAFSLFNDNKSIEDAITYCDEAISLLESNGEMFMTQLTLSLSKSSLEDMLRPDISRDQVETPTAFRTLVAIYRAPLVSESGR